MRIRAIDLFCGVGGLTYGLSKAGVSVVAGVDLDDQCRFPYEMNNSGDFHLEDVESLSASTVRKWFGNDDAVTLLAGCAPCQPFSTYSRNRSKDWRLLDSFARLIRECKPDLVTMENVPGISRTDVYRRFIATLSALKYNITEYQSLNCLQIGVPQSRHRLVVVASRIGPLDKLRMNRPIQKAKTVRQTIGHLPRIRAGERSKADPLHAAAGLTKLNLSRIKASKPGGTWRDWAPSLVANCHEKKSGRSYPSVYGRMEWDKPSPTITTQAHGYGNGRFGHPSQNRAISLREAAMLQTFPESYIFLDSEEAPNLTKLGRLIGNAVPVKLGEEIGKLLVRHVSMVRRAKPLQRQKRFALKQPRK